MKVLFAAVMILLLVFTILCTAVAYYLFKMAISRKGVKGGAEQLSDLQKKQLGMREEAARWLEGMQTRDVEIKSFDGLKLFARFLPAQDAKRTVICAHGFRVTAIKDFGPMIRYYHEHNTNVLMITERSHKESEGKYICYGVKERYDIAAWAEFLNSELVPEKLPVYLHGVSMGCASVVMASDLELPANVKGVIADCGFTSAWDEFAYILKKNFKLPTFPILNLSDLICELTAGFEMGSVSTLDIMTRERYPMLFIHGAEDDFVPTSMGVANYEKCVSKKKLVLFEGAGHALSWTADLELYEKSVEEFFGECEQ